MAGGIGSHRIIMSIYGCEHLFFLPLSIDESLNSLELLDSADPEGFLLTVILPD